PARRRRSQRGACNDPRPDSSRAHGIPLGRRFRAPVRMSSNAGGTCAIQPFGRRAHCEKSLDGDDRGERLSSAMRSIRLVVIVSVVLVVATAAHALHQESPGALALTSGPVHQTSAGRAWGNWVAFESTADLTGLGATRVPGSQIFVFNLD